MDHLHLPLVVIGSDYNNAADTGLVRITATPLLISGPADPNDTVISNTPTSITAPTTSVTASISTAIINIPTTTPQTSGLSGGAIAGIAISIILLILVIILIIIVLQCLYFRKKNRKSSCEKEATALGNISSIPSVPNEAYAAVDSIVNVQENVAYSLPAGHTITAASPPTGSSTAPPAVYETINS
ncbi:PREDICTED: cell wall integrity and stress response component 2-like [Amphimedon queenslandica]|uniref:Uncharacterized protein n=1 Tax=Amphimedon queenslandica TaxID=400682 RepID=A0AAN0J410_AMPQE|nr:PREDICTED: cell wall integrity and stress response component 2-like [Amphimedon queenslandica]|eukprot:XP_019851486.1 PREDICTED: cell wall integrity and stress response component 2-like [Amphimedon queenslandica]